MNLHIKLAFIALVVACSTLRAGVDGVVKMETEPAQRLDVRFRLFKTQNVYTHLLLDTATGAVWQLQWSVDPKIPGGTLPIRAASLVPKDQQPSIGRFTLYPTTNVYNFILLDSEDGRAWQCQWSLEAASRGLFPLPDLIQKSDEK